MRLADNAVVDMAIIVCEGAILAAWSLSTHGKNPDHTEVPRSKLYCSSFWLLSLLKTLSKGDLAGKM